MSGARNWQGRAWHPHLSDPSPRSPTTVLPACCSRLKSQSGRSQSACHTFEQGSSGVSEATDFLVKNVPYWRAGKECAGEIVPVLVVISRM